MSDDWKPRVLDPARLEALRDTALLDSPAEEAFDRLTRLASRIMGVPVTLVSLVDRDRQFFKSIVGLPEPWASQRETPLSHSFCKHVVGTGDPLVVEDAREHPLVRDNLAIPDLDVVAYAGVPLETEDGYCLGSFCAIDSQPKAWTEEEVEILRELAESAMTEVDLRREIRERERAQRALERARSAAEEARARAEEANQAKSRFLARMSHELRTPLNSVIGFSRIMRKNLDQESESRDTEYLERIEANGKHLLGLINEILDLSTIEAGRLDLEDEEVDPGELVRETVKQLEGLVPTGVTLEAEVPDGVRSVVTDRARLRQVLINLVGNALKFTDRGRVRVVVRADPAGRPLRLDVVDTGPGIPEPQLEKVFEAFERLEGDARSGKEGTGLGLAISRSLCSALGFELTLDSEAGRGSVFSVVLDPGAPDPDIRELLSD